jgi:geranylgeranyl diphosphate synthase type II
MELVLAPLSVATAPWRVAAKLSESRRNDLTVASIELAPESTVDLNRFRPAIDAALDRYSQFDDGCPAHLAEAIRYVLLGAGKRLRPHLVLFAAEACGGSTEQAMPAACAVEMIHAYSLVHDDLPAMDDDDLRRGRPTCHKVYGEDVAILVGDALQARAFELLAIEITPPERAAACCAVLGRAVGATALVGGQAADLAGEQADCNAADLEAIHRRKTGALFLASLQLGAITVDANADQQSALETYGRHLGLAFQIVDDLLDVDGDQTAVGKRLGKDADRGKATFPKLLGVDESRRRAAESIELACDAIAEFGERGNTLRAMAHFVRDRNR